MNNPDFILTQIMRQEEGDPIVQLSQMVLHDIPLFEGEYGRSRVVREYILNKKSLYEFDQILCTTNKMRNNVNQFIRYELLGFHTPEPRLGERVICRKNNWALSCGGFALTNGLSGIITEIHRKPMKGRKLTINFHPDIFDEIEELCNVDFECLDIDYNHLISNNSDDTNILFNKLERFEYAYAITVHLSQGSEYPNVLFLDQGFPDPSLSKKARYTAITRASKSITIVCNPNYYLNM
jgi:exodeoxyribonuclease-5